MNTPKNEIYARINKFQSKMVEKKVDGALIVQSVDMFYFSGTAQNAHLYIPAQGEPVLMVRKSFARAKEESELNRIVPLTSIKQIPDILSDAGCSMNGVLGLEMDVVPAAQYLLYSRILAGVQLTDVSNLIRETRQIKSEYELGLLRTSGRKMEAIYREIPQMIREGMPEIELASKIESRARAAGHIGFINTRSFISAPFFGHLMSGSSAAVPSAFDGATGGPGLTPLHPQGASTKAIQKGEPILVDYTGIWDGYITDQTRIFSIGALPEKLNHAFEAALKIQYAVIDRIEPGVNGSELHELALDMAVEAGLAENFMGTGNDQARFIGHGVGLELDELPVLAKGLNTVLEPGMVFAVEPKFVFPGQGVVGIENTFVLTENGVEKITPAPDEIVTV